MAPRGVTTTAALERYLAPNQRGTDSQWAARRLTELCGSLNPSQIGIGHIDTINSKILTSSSPFTRTCRAAALRRIIRYLVSQHRTKDLTAFVCKPKVARPRNVTVTYAERMKILEQSPPCLKCWLLMCSDMAIRSGTAVKLGPANYDKGRRMLTFTTKYQNRQELPVTEELAAMLDTCTDPTVPFVGQLSRGHHQYYGWELKAIGRPMQAKTLRKQFKQVKGRCGIERDLRPHDLRRTTAKAMYDLTGDLRAVQALLGHSQLSSTLWYLDHHVTKVELTNLELAKLNPTTETIQ